MSTDTDTAPSLRLPCDVCSGDGYATHEDRHARTDRDVCQRCGGEGTIPAATGQSPEAAFRPEAVDPAAPMVLLPSPTELDRLREEVAFWRADLAARLFMDRAAYEATVKEGRSWDAALLSNRLRSSLATFDAAQQGEWHQRCDVCGDFVRPGQAEASGDDISGHYACLAEGDPIVDAPHDGDADLAQEAERARAALATPRAEPAAAIIVAGADVNAQGVTIAVRADHQVVAISHSFTPVPVLYRNYRGEVDVRRLVLGPLWFGLSEYHKDALGAPKPQWLLTSDEPDTGKRRDFAMEGVLAWGHEAIAAYRDMEAELRILRAQRMGPERERELLDANNRLLERSRLAEGTLRRLGWTKLEGAAEWKPPLAVEPDFQLLDAMREVRAFVAAFDGGSPKLCHSFTLRSADDVHDRYPLTIGALREISSRAGLHTLPHLALHQLATAQRSDSAASVPGWSEGFGSALKLLEALVPPGWALSRAYDGGPWQLHGVAEAG